MAESGDNGVLKGTFKVNAGLAEMRKGG